MAYGHLCLVVQYPLIIMKHKEFYKWSYKTTQNDFYLKEMEVYIPTVLHRVLKIGALM